MLFIIANIGFGRDGVGEGGLSISFVGRFGVADGLSLGVEDLAISVVATGDGVAMTLGTDVGAGYRALVSPARPRVMNQAMRTPEAPRTRTIANTQGKAPLRDSPPASSLPTCAGGL